MSNEVPTEASDVALDGLMRAFYEVISFEEGGAPDWQRMQELFTSDARITRVTPEAIDRMTLAEFRGMAEDLIEAGAFTALHEHELDRRVQRYGRVMHIASAYVTKISAQADDHIAQGVNSLQLIDEDGTWRIVSLCWDDHAPQSANELLSSRMGG